MKNKILSIVIPTYNIEKYIEKCLNSFIKEELLPLIEVIVVNDGSKDNSSTLAKNFSTKYPETFRVIDKENGGHGSTINTALKEATGKFFFVVDGDDWVDADALYNVVKKLENNLDIDAIFFNYINEIQSNNKQICHKLKGIASEGVVDLDGLKLDIDNQIALPNTIFNLNNLKQINLRLDEKMFYVDVEYMLYSIPTIKKAIYIDENVYHYLIGRANQSINKKSSLMHINDRRTVILNVLNYYKNFKSNDISEFAKKSYYIKIASVISTYYDILIIGDKNFSKKIKEFDEIVKNIDEKLYNIISEKYLYIKIARKFNYSSILMKIEQIFNNFFNKAKSIIKKGKN